MRMVSRMDTLTLILYVSAFECRSDNLSSINRVHNLCDSLRHNCTVVLLEYKVCTTNCIVCVACGEMQPKLW